MGAVYFGWRISRKLKGNNGWVGTVYFAWRISGNLRETLGGWV